MTSSHAECAVRWFRGGVSTCPLCRAEGILETWTRRTPTQIVAAIRRRRVVPRAIKGPLRRLQTLETHIREHSARLTQIMSDHGPIVRRANMLARAVRVARWQKTRLVREIAFVHEHDVSTD